MYDAGGLGYCGLGYCGLGLRIGRRSFQMLLKQNVCCIACVLLLAGFCGSVRAQYSLDPDVAYMQISAEGWLFSPVTDSSMVRGFLAAVDDRETTGSNITLIWYQRETDGSWSSWGWNQLDATGNAVWWVRNHLNDPSAFSFDADLNEAAESVGPESAVAPVALSGGMQVGDPFQAIVNTANDPVGVVNFLSTYGWQIAPALSAVEAGNSIELDGASENPLQLLLDDLASDVESAYFGASFRLPIGWSWPCKCTITYGTPTCGAWVFTGSVPQSGGGLVCHYSRTCTQSWAKTGKKWYCLSCASSGTRTYTQLGSTNALPGSTCSPPPP